MIWVSAPPRKPSATPRRKPQPRRRSREESYPESLHDHLAEHVPGFRDQPLEVRHSLAYLAWIVGTGRRRHNRLEGDTTFSYRLFERLFGRGVFSSVNGVLRMFEVTERTPSREGGGTRGYRFTPEVAEIMTVYLDAPVIGLTHLTGTDGRRVNKPPRAVASKDSEGHTQAVWRNRKW